MSHPAVRRLTTLVLLLALALAAPAAAAGERQHPSPAAPFMDALVQVWDWLGRLGIPVGQSFPEKTAPPVATTDDGTTEGQRIPLGRGGMIDPNG